MPITPTDIKDVVLREDDFGHEMRVGKCLTDVKYPQTYLQNQFEQTIVWPPSHGGTYRDQATGKSRQFDFRCRVSKGYKRSQNILLAVECKNLNTEFPVVVCGRPRVDKEDYHVFIDLESPGKASLRKVEGINSIYRPDEFVGKSVLRLKRKDNRLCSDGDTEIYDRWTQALASSFDLANQAAQSSEPTGASTFIMPMVVVPDTALWIASYNDNGTLSSDPTPTDHCHYYVDFKLPIELPLVLTHIHFVTLTGLRELLSLFVSDRRKWDTIFSRASCRFEPEV